MALSYAGSPPSISMHVSLSRSVSQIHWGSSRALSLTYFQPNTLSQNWHITSAMVCTPVMRCRLRGGPVRTLNLRLRERASVSPQLPT